MIMAKYLLEQILAGVDYRQHAGLTDPAGAYRLFNGFYESSVDLVIDRYASTLVLFLTTLTHLKHSQGSSPKSRMHY